MTLNARMMRRWSRRESYIKKKNINVDGFLNFVDRIEVFFLYCIYFFYLGIMRQTIFFLGISFEGQTITNERERDTKKKNI